MKLITYVYRRGCASPWNYKNSIESNEFTWLAKVSKYMEGSSEEYRLINAVEIPRIFNTKDLDVFL